MTRDERARVLGPGGTLEHGLRKITGLGGEGHQRTEGERVDGVLAERP